MQKAVPTALHPLDYSVVAAVLQEIVIFANSFACSMLKLILDMKSWLLPCIVLVVVSCGSRQQSATVADVDSLYVCETAVDEAVSVVSEGIRYADFEAIDVTTGNTVYFSDLAADKVVLVDFWASWCKPCLRVMQDRLADVWQNYADSGIVMVSVGVSDVVDSLRTYAAYAGAQWPQLADADGTAAALYGVNAIPRLMLISRKGTVLSLSLPDAAIEAALDNALQLYDYDEKE